MRQAATTLQIETRGRGFYSIGPAVESFAQGQSMRTGLLTLFCRHTSASLLIQENADPSVLSDLETFLGRVAPEDPSQTHLSIPIIGGALMLGVWQGVFLVEHRRRPHRREIALHVIGA